MAIPSQQLRKDEASTLEPLAQTQKFAEYQGLAPEAMSQSQGLGPDKLDDETANPMLGGEQKKRVLGLAPRTAFVLILIILVVIAGIVVGAVLGTRHKHHTADSATATIETPSQIHSSAQSGTVTATPTAFTIIEAIYAAVDVTAQTRSAFPQGPNLVVDMSSTSAWAGSDPWVNVKKCLALLHSYGASVRTFVACEGDGILTLVPGNADSSPHTQEIWQHGPSNDDFAIASVVWGAEEIRDGDVYNALYAYKLNGSVVPFENWVFGKDTLPNWPKSGVIWYTEDKFLTFKSISAQEGVQIPF